MNANELLKRIIASGADEKGISDRFNGNAELYEQCFLEFMDEPCFAALREAVRTQSYEAAFKSAHALKGFAGNLGVTQLYNAIRTLTDSLRKAQYDNIEKEHANVEYQYERLRRIISDEPEQKQEDADNKPLNEKKRVQYSKIRFLMKDRGVRFFALSVCAVIAVVAAVGLLLYLINVTHTRKVVQESGQHLTEISNQIKLYIEESIDTDWKIAESAGDSILEAAYADDDLAVLDILQRKQAVWDVSDLMLYTENGYCINAGGSSEETDIAAMTIYHARQNGKYLSVLDSNLIYTVPLDAELTYKGSKIVAVSVVRDMSSFLDNMKFSSFGGTACLYITDTDGVIVSSLSSPFEVKAFNMQAIVGETDIVPLNDECLPEDFLTCSETEIFTLSGILNQATESTYGVSSPLITGAEPMRLYYFVPENVVNSIMSGFSRQLVFFSMFIIVLFAAGAFSASTVVYRSKKKMFDRAIMARERMFDLLIKNTRTAFGLFTANMPKPEYLSANAAEVIGDSYWALNKTDAGFSVHNDSNTVTDNIAFVNEELLHWDGKSTFRSGYLCNRQGTTCAYFVFELYPVDDGSSDFIGIAQDVTRIYTREEAAKEAMESAKQANNAKTRFLSSMSHDIRTPMNAIMNMSNFALESVDQPKKLGNYLRIIHESAEHLLHLINDVLDMSRIESGQIIVSSAPFDIKKEIQRQADIIRPLCNAKNQTLMTDFSGLNGTIVTGDALKLSQIVINLLSNAMKFTPEKGAVRFTAGELPSLSDTVVTVRLTNVFHIRTFRCCKARNFWNRKNQMLNLAFLFV